MYDYRREIERDYGTDSHQLARYDAMLADGQPPQFAAMLACQDPPGTKGTDRALMEGGEYLGARGEMMQQRVLQTAKAAGVDINGKRHISGLGHVTDPLSWVSSTSDVLAACRAKGLSCSGVVNHQGPEPKPIAPVPMAKDLIQEQVARRCAADPALAEKVRKNPKLKQEVAEAVIEKHAYKPPKKG
jgi:hypothetical protein